MTAATLMPPTSPLLSKTVLVVDDDIGLQDTLCDILHMSGVNAASVGSAAEAFDWCERHNPDLVLLDQRLPDASGLQLAALLKARTPTLSIVLLTGFASADNAIAAVGLVDDYLTKPVPPAELLKVVQTHLEQHRLRIANQELLAQLKDSNSRLEKTVAERTRELVGARDEAMEASRLKSQFLANMSHEIRTPMNGVLGAADLLAATDLTEDQRSYVEILSRSGRSLLAIINNILDFSKIEAGHLEVENSAFPLLDPFNDIVDMLSPQATAKGLLLKLQAASGLPPTVAGDAVRLQQVITNLVGNAVKFTDEGSVIVNVAVVSESPDRVVVRCTVMDTGIGISAQDATRLFKDFTQVDPSNTRRFGGTGLGLAISDRLIELMGGKIGCEANPVGGSIFWFTLPFAIPTPERESHISAQPHVAQQPAHESPPSPPSGPRLLIVEDNEVNAVILTRMLELLGYRSDTVGSGDAALAAVDRGAYEAVLMDCQMPVMDGFTTTRRLRIQTAGKPRIPVIAITATATTEDQQQCFAAGMDDYLPKPIIMERLSAILGKWVPTSTH